jgi:hypothetical protein
MSLENKVGFFPGFFDPDGRPWEETPGGVHKYQLGLESALKIALLTQRHIYIPYGYLLDNPFFQRIFLKYKGDHTEAKCFRALMKDLIRISLSDSSVDTITDWRSVLRQWIEGTGSQRGRLAYLNCLSADAAEVVQQSMNVDSFESQMRQALDVLWGIDLPEFLGICNELKLSTKDRAFFRFDDLLRQRLLSGDEQFPIFCESLADKVHAIAEAASSDSRIRLSRSLLQNPVLCRDLGVRDELTLSRSDYKELAPVLAHYHHYAFAESLGMTSFVTRRMPTPDMAAMDLLREQLEHVTHNIIPASAPVPMSWPLGAVRFENIWHVRLSDSSATFFDNLNMVYDAVSETDTNAYRYAMQKHMRHIAKVISFDFREPNAKELAAGLDGAVLANEPTAAGALSLAKYAFTFFRDFAPNVGKELQVRWFFRKLQNTALGDGA